MSKKLRIVLAQLNLIVGDIDGNLEKIIQSANAARDTHQADLIIYPELAITGYPPEDLLLRDSFIALSEKAINKLKTDVHGIYCLIGHPHKTSQGLFNSCSLIYKGTILGRYNKQYLPNYGVFDESRYFIPGSSPDPILINGISVAIMICEDLWHPSPTYQAGLQGAQIILVPNASPFEAEKHEQRIALLKKRARTSNTTIVYVNCVGGQDELVFDGGSMVINQDGQLCQHAGFFNETLLPVTIDISSTATNINSDHPSLPSVENRIYNCLVLGLRDYVLKNGFKGVILGVSGGIDSALTLAIAVDALGKENVLAVYMPSQFNTSISSEDSLVIAKNLGVEYQIISIEEAYTTFLTTLAPSFSGRQPDVTEENIQSRCRGVILMSLSNKLGRLVLATSNRSEFAVGYATLYGDMVGAYAVLKDIPKTLVYALAHYRNTLHPDIPERTLKRPPTAELAPDQFDEDSLPPYSILDPLLELYLNQGKSTDEIVALGFEPDVVDKIITLIKKNEYKRRQAPPGPHINHTSFIRDWRYPITSKFKK